MPPPASLRLDFTAEPAPAVSPETEPAGAPQPGQQPRTASAAPQTVHASGQAGRERPAGASSQPRAATIFGEEDELPPTWSEASTIFHTWSKCTRLQSIRRNRRITGNPGLREHCLNCISIAATHRRG